MRKLVLLTSVIVILTAGWIFYLNHEKKNFIENLPQSPAVVNQPINNSSSSVNEMEASNDFVKVAVDGERFSPDDRVPELLPQEQNASAEKTSSETPTPDEKADFVRDQWIQMFGDIPQVHAAAEYMRKIYKNEMTLDDEIAGLEASHYLFPDGGHGILLEMRKSAKARGIPVTYLTEEDRKNLRYAENIKRVVIGEPPPHLRRKNAQIGNAPDSISSESIDGDIDFLPARSEGTPVMPESETSVASDHVHYEAGHVHKPPTPGHGTDTQPPAPTAAKGVEANGWEGLSLKQREQAKQLFDQYGTEEGLRRFRDTDPEAARQFERERRKPPVPSEPSDEPSTR